MFNMCDPNVVPYIILGVLPVLRVLRISRIALTLLVHTLLQVSVYIRLVAFVSIVLPGALLSHHEWPNVTQQLQARLEGQWYTRQE